MVNGGVFQQPVKFSMAEGLDVLRVSFGTGASCCIPDACWKTFVSEKEKGIVHVR
jgi:hypothetical protein